MNVLKFTSLMVIGITMISMAAIKKDLQDTWDVPETYQKMKNPYSDVDDDGWGRTLYSKHCKFCHGNKGKGDGNQAKLLQTPAANFTSKSFKSQTDGSVYYKIRTGRNEMPGFEKVLTDEEDIWMLVNYIKSL